MPIKLLLSLLLSFPFFLSAQILPDPDLPDLSGTWTGTLYQNEGGYAETFGFVLEIEQKGYAAEGTSRVFIDDIAAAITFVATREQDGKWLFMEQKVVNSRKPEFLEWCFKQYRLELKYTVNGDIILSGPWWGASKSGRCIPGTIILKRTGTRA